MDIDARIKRIQTSEVLSCGRGTERAVVPYRASKLVTESIGSIHR